MISNAIDHHLPGAPTHRHFSNAFRESVVSASIPMMSNPSTCPRERLKQLTAGRTTFIMAYWLLAVHQVDLTVVRLLAVVEV